MYVNDNGLIVENADKYISIINGTQYPQNYPKSEISELHLVTEVARPVEDVVVVTGFTAVADNTDPQNIVYNQVWTTRAKTQEELDADLVTAKTNKILELYATNDALKTADIEFTTAGAVTKDFQADARSKEAIHDMLVTYPTATPNGFYWRSSDNTNVTPFTKADLDGLTLAIGDRGWGYFQHLMTKKDAVMAATTVTAVDAITW